MKVNSIYVTFQGEQNPCGIGAPVIFLRLQGCHLRCYQKTLGVLCDTPEGLSRDGGDEMPVPEIISRLEVLRAESGGVNLICLSGGDPLWRDPKELMHLFGELQMAGFKTVVETSGTLSMAQYSHFSSVNWVLDYKTISAGVPKSDVVLQDVVFLRPTDYVKFVLHDAVDYLDFCAKLETLQMMQCRAKIAVGVFWGGDLTTFKLVEWLLRDKLFGKVVVNMQAHKALLHDTDKVDPKLT